MLFKHPYFVVDTDKRTVWDEHGKQLHVTGNAFIMLEFLCKNKQGTVTSIGDAIDPVKGYNEDDLRQLRHKIKTAVGRDVIVYRNHIYSFAEDSQSVDRVELKVSPQSDQPASKQKPRRSAMIAVALIVLICAAVLTLASRIVNGPGLVEVKKPQADTVLIPAGDFIMGSTEEQALDALKNCEEANNCLKEDYLAEFPRRKIYLKDFYIDKKEISNAAYQAFVRATGRKQPTFAGDSNLNTPSQPVVGVSWEDARSYCGWLSERLPTETEWEKAARGTDGRAWPWGNEWDGKKLNHGQGGSPGLDESDGFKYTAPVGVELGVSTYGVLNMAGNVSEWVSDTFLPYSGNDKFLNSHFGEPYKVVRGGSYTSGRSDTRTAARYYHPADYIDDDIGFRCAKDK